MSTLLITATDTAAGKTVLTTALLAYWQTYYSSRSIGVMKLIQSGVGDRELYQELFTLDQSLETINPLYFQAPLAPPIAARQESQMVDLGKVWSALQKLQHQRELVLAEALGGLGCPVTAELTVADLARDWQLPAVLVVPVKLGAIGQVVAHVALAQHMKVKLLGIVLNCVHPCSDQEVENWAPTSLIQSLTQTPVLGLLPHLDNPQDVAQLTQGAANLDLELLLPLQFAPSR
ncbi:MAG: ATP-dependent dethiobiotin synthetase BioD [Oscillatoriales cyanobacterium RM1_1_9]|nr:ATP-dependent dethiobiotin synthetase BioD [Oscillatoriales cyanobacterium SM2_3_0]NJO47144.1 ATP-dependent dethiobiotin synthetase BioD [Oscillatoriales cyanobacterium RM2_1_1]NJO70724.1 ATP-dependent dethiobiotin synthetase BioD [Oscillatoriales cyanobacterium RM1_1_9]